MSRNSCPVARAIRPRRIFPPTSGPETYAEWLKAIPRHATAQLYLHVPFCASMCWHCGRHTSVLSRSEPIAVYESALRCEIDLVSRQIDRRIKVDRIHLGGGTPTIMAPESFTDLIGSIRHCFFVLPAAEIAVEIDPRTLKAPMIEALALGGVNRASLGVQTFDPARAARHQPGAEFRRDGRGDQGSAARRHRAHRVSS